MVKLQINYNPVYHNKEDAEKKLWYAYSHAVAAIRGHDPEAVSGFEFNMEVSLETK